MIPVDPSGPEPPAVDSELPAPYANPWGLLGQDLRAVVADLRLQILRLWRRNSQGDLPLPGLWPRDLAPLFWPLVLALALAATIAVASLVMGWVGSAGSGSSAVLQQAPSLADGAKSEEAVSDQALLDQDGSNQAMSEPAGMELAPAVGSPVSPPEADGLAQEPQPSPEPFSASSPEPSFEPSLGQLSPDEQAQSDLAAALAAQPGGQWIAGVTVESEGALLRLQLNAGFTTLAAAQQQTLAEAWQDWAQGFGFDRLELTDRRGQVLGRQALVGSGMILLSPQHLS